MRHLFLTSGKPPADIGGEGDYAFEPDSQLLYYKSGAGWNAGVDFIRNIPAGKFFISANDVCYGFEGAAAPDDQVQAGIATNLTGTNNDLAFTAVPLGAAGNAISIEYLDPEGNDVPLSVAVEGNAIVFTLATGVAGAITTIADDIAALAISDAGVAALVTAANKAANDGSDEVTAMAATFLEDGVDGTGAGFAGKGSQFTDYVAGKLYLNTGTKASPTWEELAPAA